MIRSALLALLFIAGPVPSLFVTQSAWSMSPNRLCQRFVEHLKVSQYVRLERLVTQNRTVAVQALKIVRDRAQTEKDPHRKEAYTIVAQELAELIALTSGSKDCDMSAQIVRRGKDVAIPEDALEAFRRAVTLCPDNVDALLGIAESNKRLGRFDETLAAYEKILALKDDTPEALAGMGEVLYAAGLYQRSMPLLEKTRSLKPGNRKAKALLSACMEQNALDRDGIITSDEIVDRLWASVKGELMCMCPVPAKLIARIRFRSITFGKGSIRLDAQAKVQLGELATALKSDGLKHGRFLIEGHADPSGAPAYNVALSLRRAELVRWYLAEILGVNPALVSVSGVGASRSWTANDTPSGRRANRRIEIVSLGNVDRETVPNEAEKGGNQRRVP